MGEQDERGTEPVADRWRRVAARFSARAAEVPPERWDAPAPCEGWVARDIVDHMDTWMRGLLARVDVELPPGPAAADDPVGAWAALDAGIQAVLDDPVASARQVQLSPMGPQPLDEGIGQILLGDVVVHTWDLARAAGLDESLDEDVAAEMLAGMEPLDDLLRSSGHYGPRVPVPDDADVVTRLVAFTGRTP